MPDIEVLVKAWSVWDVIVYIGMLSAGLGLLGFIYYVMSDNNPLEWWHFIATRGADGQHYADIDKLGKVVGIFTSSTVVIWMGYQSKLDTGLLLAYLAFVGGIGGYSAYLRSKREGSEGRPTNGS